MALRRRVVAPLPGCGGGCLAVAAGAWPAAVPAGRGGVPAVRTKGTYAARAGSVVCGHIEQCEGLPLGEDLAPENGG